jgi:hypothetical protein
MANTFTDFLTKKRKSGLAAASTEDLIKEVENRSATKNIFPLSVFNKKLEPFINALVDDYDVPRSFVGLCLLSSYSTAIGTAYTVSTNNRDHIYLPIWACLTGISSSGKSLALGKALDPLNEIQEQFDTDWYEKTRGKTRDAIQQERMQAVIYRDAHIPTLVRYILPDNPKGILKHADELVEWINGMNQLSKKEGTDEQFWLSSWNCTAYSGIRAGKDKFVNKRPFVNIVGGIQYSVLHKLFAKDRDTTGFVFRLLFALPDEIKIADPTPGYYMPAELSDVHRHAIERLYDGLPVDNEELEPKRCILTPDAVKIFNDWNKAKIRLINHMEEIAEKELHSGIFGKVKEYALRFSAVLHLTDKALSSKNPTFFHEERVEEATMQRALQLADYFYQSALDVYEKVNNSVTAPPDVLRIATLMKMGKSFADIAELEWKKRDEKSKQKMYRLVKKLIREYPRVFNAIAKN